MHDELRYSVRKGLMQDLTKETVTLRHTVRDTALPMRRWGSFLLGTGLGGSMVHWRESGSVAGFTERWFAWFGAQQDSQRRFQEASLAGLRGALDAK